MKRGISVQRKEGLPFQRLGKDILVVVPRERDVHLLNETSARIWDLLEKPATREELVASLLEIYDVGKAQARKEVTSIMKDMESKGLLGEVSK